MKLLPCALGPSLTLDEARTLDPNFSSAATLPEKTTEIALGCPSPIRSYRTDFLFAYDIFPSFLMRAEPQWIRERRAMQIGDVILQRAVLPPVGFGLCAEFAVRVSAIFSEPRKLGFAYETLAGHLERGISEFLLRGARWRNLLCHSYAFRARTLAVTARRRFTYFAVPAMVHAAGASACEAALSP